MRLYTQQRQEVRKGELVKQYCVDEKGKGDVILRLSREHTSKNGVKHGEK